MNARGLVLAAAVAAVGSVRAVEVDGVAAYVGSDVLLRSDVVNEMRRRGETDAQRYGETLQDMIDHKLIVRAAAESKMTLQEWMVENRVREIIAKAFDGDRNKLIETLGRQKMSYPEWRARLREDMLVGAMRWNVVDKNVTATPSALRKEFAEHPERYARGERVTVAVIMLSPENAAKRAEIDADLAAKKSFADLGAKEYRDIVAADYFNETICEAIAALPVGLVGRWIEIDGWSYLLRKESQTPGKKLTFEEALGEVEANVKEAAAKKLYEAWLARLREETYIKVF